MAIRLEHQPIGIAGLAAYAAGSGRKKERDRKYVTDLVQNQQERFDKYNLLANQQQFQINRDIERAGVERAQAQRQNEFRIGAMNLANQQARERDALNFAQGEFADRRDYARSLLAKLPPIPEHAPVVVRKILEKARGGIAEMTTGQFDLNHPDDGAAFNEAVRSYNAGVAAIPPQSLDEKVNADTVQRDSTTGRAYSDWAPGRTPYSVSTGKPVFDQAKPVAPGETVTVNGQQFPVKTYQDHVKGVVAQQKDWDKGFDKAGQNAITPAAEKAAQEAYEKRRGPRPETPPSVMELQQQQAAAQATTAPVAAFANLPTAVNQTGPAFANLPTQAGTATGPAFANLGAQPQAVQQPPVSQPIPTAAPPALATAPAQQQVTQPPVPAAPAGQASAFDIPRPVSKQDYDQLPPGTVFIAPDGSTRRK